MTLLHFDLRKPVGHTGFRIHFFLISKNFLISIKIYIESFQLVRSYEKCLNFQNLFINNRIDTFLFCPWESLCDSQDSELIFYKIQKHFLISIKIYTESFQLRFDDECFNFWNGFINNRVMTILDSPWESWLSKLIFLQNVCMNLFLIF